MKSFLSRKPATTLSISALLLTLAFGLTGCGAADSSSHPYAVDGSQLPNLDSLPDGGVVLSWVEADAGGHRLRFAVLNRGRWSEARTISRGDDWFVNWADFPSVRIIDEQFWVAHWLVKHGAAAYSYDVAISTTDDAGRTWSEPVVLHSDDTASEHGFVSIFPLDTVAGFVWLDGRETVKEPSAGQIAGMTLRSAEMSPAGKISESLIDPLVCDCCQTDVAISSRGPLLVYRDRSQQDVRDIRLARYQDGRWTVGERVAEDNWQVFGCPVNGPAISAAADQVGIAWYTQGSGSPVVHFVRSTDGGQTFSNSVAVDSMDPIGRVDVAVDSTGCAIVSWIGKAETDSGALRYRFLSGNGEMSDAHTLAEISTSRPSGFPRMARAGNGVVVAWTDLNEGSSQVMTAELPFNCPSLVAGD